MTKLHLAPSLSIPADVVTQTLLVVGKRGSGKSNTAAVLVEQLHHAKIPFVVLDPVDTWWGLKASRDGTGPGLEGIYVFGGRHADLPLEPGEKSGALVAEILCEHRLPMVLSVKHLSGRERSTFMVAFAQTLFQKWTGGPLHVVLEEAHELAPQNVQTAREGEQQMLGAFKRLWKLGRASGIGGTAITQRPASLSKDITTQSEILVAHRTIGPQDVKAIGEWIKYHGEQSSILAELPSLPTGDAFVWAPEFPEAKPIGLKRVAIALRETYDSASTPKVGEHRVEPKELAPVDIDRLRTKMAATIERAKAEDPKELRKEIQRLERELAGPTRDGQTIVTHETMVSQIDAAVHAVRQEYEPLIQQAIADEGARHERYRKVILAEIDAIRQEVDDAFGRVDTAHEGLLVARKRLAGVLEVELETGGWVRPMPDPAPYVMRPAIAMPAVKRVPVTITTASSAPRSSDSGGLSSHQRKLLDAVARFAALNVAEPTRAQVAGLAGVSSTSSTTDQAFGKLVVSGLLDGRDGRLMITAAGQRQATRVEAVPTLREYHDTWRGLLSGSERKLFEAMLAARRTPIARADLSRSAGISFTSSTTDQAYGKLIGLEIFKTAGAGAVEPGPTMLPRGLR